MDQAINRALHLPIAGDGTYDDKAAATWWFSRQPEYAAAMQAVPQTIGAWRKVVDKYRATNTVPPPFRPVVDEHRANSTVPPSVSLTIEYMVVFADYANGAADISLNDLKTATSPVDLENGLATLAMNAVALRQQEAQLAAV